MIPESDNKILKDSKNLVSASFMANKPFCDSLLEQFEKKQELPNFSSPVPNPLLFLKEKTFSLKKERPPSRGQPPPTPRPYVSGGLDRKKNKFIHKRPHSISFIDSNTPLSSKHYNEKSNDLYFNQCFDIICKLGTGSFGEVFKVQSKDDGKYYAVKKSKRKFQGTTDRQRKIEEVKKHEWLPKHTNCVSFYKAWEEDEHLYLQLELCETSLCQYSEENHEIPESTVWQYLVDLLLATKHLHDHNYIHLDIKPENIFVKNNICKLGDFGLMLDATKPCNEEAMEGDSKYMAPELMNGIFTKAADIFSLGITILELACDLDLPNGNEAWHKLRQREIPTEFLENLTPELSHVIQIMMEPDYQSRPTVDFILALDSVHKMHEQRKPILELEQMSANEMPVQSMEWDSSFSDDVFSPNKSNSFSSQADSSYEHIKSDESIDYKCDEFLVKRSFSEYNFCSDMDLRRKENNLYDAYVSSSSPKLGRRFIALRNRKNIDDVDTSFLKPQRLLNIFNEQETSDISDTSF